MKIRQVNEYSDQSSDTPRTTPTRGTIEDRMMLENITKQLHLVSQTADSGIASAHMSIKIAEQMLESHSMFIMAGEREKISPGPAASFVRDTHGTLEYIRNSFYCQRDWLTTYKARKDTAMNFVSICDQPPGALFTRSIRRFSTWSRNKIVLRTWISR